MKIVTTAALAAATVLTFASAVSADAVSDQKKAYNALGIDVSKNKPALCNLLTKAEVERFLGEPVREGTTAGPVVSGCAWHAANGSNDGLLVTRSARTAWYPPTYSKSYRKVAGIGDAAYTNFEDGLGYEAVARSAKGVTGVQFSGKGSAAAALGVLRIVVTR
jgi:hypothetical protein